MVQVRSAEATGAGFTSADSAVVRDIVLRQCVSIVSELTRDESGA